MTTVKKAAIIFRQLTMMMNGWTPYRTIDKQYTRTMISVRSPQNRETEYYTSPTTNDVTRIIDRRIVRY